MQTNEIKELFPKIIKLGLCILSHLYLSKKNFLSFLIIHKNRISCR